MKVYPSFLKSMASPQIWGPKMLATGPFSLKSNIWTVLSQPPDTMILLLSGLNLTANTLFECPGKSPFSFS